MSVIYLRRPLTPYIFWLLTFPFFSLAGPVTSATDSAATPTPTPTPTPCLPTPDSSAGFLFPDDLPFQSHRSSPFTLREKLNNQLEPAGDCLSFDTDKTCRNDGQTIHSDYSCLLVFVIAEGLSWQLGNSKGGFLTALIYYLGSLLTAQAATVPACEARLACL